MKVRATNHLLRTGVNKNRLQGSHSWIGQSRGYLIHGDMCRVCGSHWDIRGKSVETGRWGAWFKDGNKIPMLGCHVEVVRQVLEE